MGRGGGVAEVGCGASRCSPGAASAGRQCAAPNPCCYVAMCVRVTRTPRDSRLATWTLSLAPRAAVLGLQPRVTRPFPSQGAAG